MTLVGCSNASRDVDTRMVILTDTLHVSEFYISESMLPDTEKDERIQVVSEPFELEFDDEGTLLLPLSE